MKDFVEEFDKIKNLIVSGEPFGFSRFSDGEVTILQNNVVVLAKDYFIQGDLHGDGVKFDGNYLVEEQKEFYPDKHEFYHKKLVESFKFRKKNYIKGIPPQNASYGDVSWKFCVDLYGDGDMESLSFCNVMINGNYHRFVTEIIPELSKKKIVMICNENATFDNLPFEVVKAFRCGTNCMINNYNFIGEISKWIEDNDVKDHTFLFSAATLTNYLIYELFKHYDTNQYIDIGSSLGYHLGLKGCYYRGYLNLYWNKGLLLNDIDIWN
tara:strand:- start:484 stop:1284 length:801 start_codon:yes stop_codon:yes gene_type:complete